MTTTPSEVKKPFPSWFKYRNPLEFEVETQVGLVIMRDPPYSLAHAVDLEAMKLGEGSVLTPSYYATLLAAYVLVGAQDMPTGGDKAKWQAWLMTQPTRLVQRLFQGTRVIVDLDSYEIPTPTPEVTTS